MELSYPRLKRGLAWGSHMAVLFSQLAVSTIELLALNKVSFFTTP